MVFFNLISKTGILFACFLTSLSQPASLVSTKYSNVIYPPFYNVSVLSANQQTNLQNWVTWKNKMPRYTFSLDTVRNKSNNFMSS